VNESDVFTNLLEHGKREKEKRGKEREKERER